MKNPVVRTFGVSAVATLAIWVATAWGLGLSGLIAVVVLTVLEVSVSADNAVVNARLIAKLSPMWQQLFLFVGIFIAVFVVRFFLPILIVSVTSGLGVGEVVQLTFRDPAEYARHLHEAAPAINAFGGSFLLMLGVGFFLNEAKKIHWIPFEKRLSALGRYDNIGIVLVTGLILLAALPVRADIHERLTVLTFGLVGILLNMILGILDTAFNVEGDEEEGTAPTVGRQVKQLVGISAFIVFMRLELLDASFSLDGVIGAFALSTNVIVIMAGLGAGALWVRSGSIWMVRQGTLAKFIYLEHGAYWAITALGGVMMLEVFHVNLPEWAVASIGMVAIGWAVWSSRQHRLRKEGAGVHRRGRMSA